LPGESLLVRALFLIDVAWEISVTSKLSVAELIRVAIRLAAAIDEGLGRDFTAEAFYSSVARKTLVDDLVEHYGQELLGAISVDAWQAVAFQSLIEEALPAYGRDRRRNAQERTGLCMLLACVLDQVDRRSGAREGPRRTSMLEELLSGR
jgi:hypothetical protein